MSEKILVVTAAHLVEEENSFFGYAPYIKEMEIWSRNSGGISFVCPVLKTDPLLLRTKIMFEIDTIHRLVAFDIKSVGSTIKALPAMVRNFVVIYRAMRKADHIHLRCPGNIGLLGCIAQIFFPGKKKTAKYAGNWDPKSKQPFSYRIQKWILNNAFLTRKMQVLVYGHWENSSKNIKPFFTATYSETDKINIAPRSLDSVIRFVFVGTLSAGKHPEYAIQLVEEISKHRLVRLDIYGDGQLRRSLSDYLSYHNLEKLITLHGNAEKDTLIHAYQNSHFAILASKSEGWPKVVAEAMFWGCVPIVTNVSCVYEMIGYGSRGILAARDVAADAKMLLQLLEQEQVYKTMSETARVWSQQFTIEKFETEIKLILHGV